MALRNSLLIFSILMIGFCLSLYFQPDQPIQSTLSFDQYQFQEISTSRSNSLEEFNSKVAPLKLEDLINDIFIKNKLAGEKTRVMHIGIKNGRILLQLKKKFPDIEFYGISKEKTHDLYRRESLFATALKYQIFSEEELRQITLPYLVFQDFDYGQKIPYDNEKFDVIFTLDAIPRIRYTFELFNEILRLLKLGGVSIHTDFTGVNIYHQGAIVDLRETMRTLRKMGMDTYVLDINSSLWFKKSQKQDVFPLTPHSPIPNNLENLSPEQKRPEMSYNLI